MKNSISYLFLLILLLSNNLFSQTYWYVQFDHNYNVEGDQIGVGLWGSNPYPYNAPYYDYVYNNSVVNLEAYGNQWVENNSFKISFNDTEATDNKSKWEAIIPYTGITWDSDNQITHFTANTSIFPVGSNPIVRAYMKRHVRVTFSNQFSGSSMGGQMVVNSQTLPAPTENVDVIEENYISFQALQSYTDNGIIYDFEKWSDNVTSSNRTKKFYWQNDNSELTAIYKGYPIFNENPSQGNLRNLTITPSVPHGYVKLTWNEHPHDGVTKYNIYRRYKYNGVYSPITLIANINRGDGGTHTYTDIEFEIDEQNGDYVIEYDVKAYFAPDNTESSNNFKGVIGNRSGQLSKISSGEEITYYDISNYPNPYNPQTTIRFQLPQEGFVTIKVYDAIGKEVATLLNEEKDSGIYELRFNGIDLPSGMYIYTIKVNDYFASKKMLLIK